MKPTYLELFAGVGGLSYGLDMAGWGCVGHAEIEKFPRQVLRTRWPDTPLYGDVSTLTATEILANGPAPLLLSGGSPCQDLSVAGKRAGMTDGSGTRSSLFFEQVRIWNELKSPYFLWENVLGAFSSNAGRDFASVLSAVVGAPIPVPDDGWRSAGVASGPAGVAAWRVLDAQYFGVPQRRRRVFVLGVRAGGVDPADVLALSESVSGHPAPCREAGQGTARSLAVGAYDDRNQAFAAIHHSLRAEGIGGRVSDAVMAFHATQTPISGAVAPSLGATATVGIVDKQSGQHSVGDTPTLKTDLSHDMGPVVAVRTAQTSANGHGFADDVAHTLDGANGQALLFTKQQHGAYEGSPNVASTLGARDHASQNTDLVVSPTINTTMFGKHCGSNQNVQELGQLPEATGRPRRLTPLECERLMGWPDGWTNIEGASDSSRYKACGNGVASPVAAWIGFRLKQALRP